MNATRPAFATTNAAVSFFCSAPLGLSETKLGSQSLCHETSCLETGAKLSRRSRNQFQWCSRITASKVQKENLISHMQKFHETSLFKKLANSKIHQFFHCSSCQGSVPTTVKITPNTKIRKPASCASSSICRDVVVFHCSADPGRCTHMQNVTRNGFPRTILLWFRTFLYVWSLLPKTDAQMTDFRAPEISNKQQALLNS